MASTYEEDLKKKNQQAAQEQQKSAQQTVSTTNNVLKGLSQNTQQNLENYQTYKPSDAVMNAQAALNNVNTAKPGAYTSQYDAQIQDIYNKIMGRQDFSYDLNADMLYQQYKDQYQLMGKQAMQDTMGQAAALTGGYGNSYAATAGNQAYQGYLQQLNNKIPELYALAYDQYNQEGQDLMQQYQMAQGAEDAAYGRYQDQYNQWLNEYQMANDAYNTEREWDYGQNQDALAYWQGIAQQENADYWKGRDQAYQTAMAMLQSGKLPGDDMLYAAGLSAEDAETLKALYAAQAKKSSGGSKKPTYKEWTEDMYNTAVDLWGTDGFGASSDYIQAMILSGYDPNVGAGYGSIIQNKEAEKTNREQANKNFTQKVVASMPSVFPPVKAPQITPDDIKKMLGK